MADYKFDKNFGRNSGAHRTVLDFASSQRLDAHKRLNSYKSNKQADARNHRDNARGSRVTGVLLILPEIFLALFVLIFAVTRIAFSGFYVFEGRTTAIVLCSVLIGIILVSSVVFFALMRLHRRTGAYIIRWTLCASAYVLAGFLLYILGAWGYLMLICSLALAALVYELANLYVRGLFGPVTEPMMAYAAIAMVVVLVFGFIVVFGGCSMEGDSAYVKTRAFSRSERYELDDDGVTLDTVMLTVSDLFSLGDEKYEPLAEVVIDGTVYKLEAIGKGALRGAYGISSVTLPASVETIESGAFSDSGVTRVSTSSAALFIEDGFLGSTVTELHIDNAGEAVITLGEGASFGENFGITVALEHYTAFCANNPSLVGCTVPV